VARLGELIEPLGLEGLVAEEGGRPVGLATVRETDEGGLEVVTLHAEPPLQGAGSLLLETALQVAAASGHHRLWLVTTNDNLEALHFYLRRGMHVAAVHSGAVERDRVLKPEIPAVNADNGIPIRDLLELELRTDSGSPRAIATLPSVRFPRVDDLDLLPIEAFVHELTPLFEGAPTFLSRLAERRPFATDAGLIEAAFEEARGLAEADALELIEAHPRIGAPPETVSRLSYADQGYASEEADAETARAYEELGMLNEIYEHRFGFRYVIFVAGRPKTAIVPLLEAALRNDRQAELRRAVADTVYIAADRLATLRG
jgi:2-oxo-4-hydroxy-4-carboxy--5-ureidoimidazoline (OHCU) decarboxylase